MASTCRLQIVSEALADGGDAVDVEPRLDLQLDADVAVVEVAGHLVEQLGRPVGDPDGHAGGHAVGDRAEVLGERHSGGAQLGVEHGHLHRRLGHRMALEHGEQAADVVGGDIVVRRTAAARRSGR